MNKKNMATTNGKRGGNLVGKPHKDKQGNDVGGIKAVVTDANGRPVELEGGEVIINKEASKKHWKELSRINQSAGGGVPIDRPIDPHDEDPQEYAKGGKIQFNPNQIPNKWILKYAQHIKKNYPEIWKKGGNIFGNQAFVNLERVAERGNWLDSEEWMYIKWRSYVARHKADFRIEGVVAMLKWVDKVDKGWQYMKNLIEDEIKKSSEKKGGWNVSKEQRMSKGGELEKGIKTEMEHKDTIDKFKRKGVSDRQVAKSIAKDHLEEDSKYYSKLSNIESMANGGALYIAPNGKPSNLTPEQYKLVRSPEFKAWFGDWENNPESASKVVDSNGEPLPVYHGSELRFTEFKNRNPNIKGYFFSNEINTSRTYGEKTYEVFLNIKSPFSLDAKGGNFQTDLDIEVAVKYPNEEEYKTTVKENSDNIVRLAMGIDKNSFWKLDGSFDGCIFYNFKDQSLSSQRNEIQNTYVAFKPNQIKLADGTNTTFDSNNPDIRFEQGGGVKNKSFVVFFKSNLLDNIVYTNVDSDSLENAIKTQKSTYNWSDIQWIKGFEQKDANNLQEFFLQNIKQKWETKSELLVKIKDDKIIFSRNKDSVAFDFMPMFEIKENERVFKEGYLTNENVEIYIDSDFNFDRNKIFELILNKMAKGGTTTRQQAKIGYTMREFKEGKLKTSYGETVTDEKQALAIALSKAGIEKKEYGGMIEIGLQGFYNGKKRLPITVTKTNAKNIYFRNEETGEIKRSERKNFERLFESGSSTNVMPIIDDTPSFKLDDIKADDVTKKGSAIPSTISAVWDKEYIVGDRVRIRIDFTTDSTTNTRDYAGIGSYFTNKNDFKIVSKLSDNSMKRPQNPTGILYTLNNGQNWEGKDLEPFDLSSQTGMPKKQKKDSAKDDSAKVDYYAMFKQNNKVIEMSNNETLAIQLGRFITMVGEDKLMTIENVQDFKSAIDKLG